MIVCLESCRSDRQSSRKQAEKNKVARGSDIRFIGSIILPLMREMSVKSLLKSHCGNLK